MKISLVRVSIIVMHALSVAADWTDFGAHEKPVSCPRRAIIQGFEKCRENSVIVFQNTTYNIEKAMSFKHLDNVRIEIKGTLLWSKDIQYWLKNSLPIGPGVDQESYPPAAYQNQTTAMILGGKRLHVEGYGHGTFDGNGQTWYDFVRGESNYPNRPHALVVTAEDSYFHGLRFVQPQMWTVTVVGSKRVLLEDIYVNATSSNRNPARNTDGANTMFSDRITFRRWTIQNGDDCIAAKANSTNIIIEDSTFHDGQGVAIGSIGQYYGRFETVENVTARNIVAYGSRYLGRIKTWTGEQNDWPPNGGGGGIGYVKNINWDNVTIHDGSRAPFVINQCYTNVDQANCSTSTFDISDISYKNVRGSIRSANVAEFQCSRSHGGCDRIVFENVQLENIAVDPPVAASKYKCSNVNEPDGFKCG
ncbi:polygalacturonase [Verticillium alfalfae VaMs.102]|uniref:Polygalacturonase n=1 Tax=Verticillium alfalfae (strain VaMs.102 / ATCC MYA-4576 / FGSC 10136) TaxID=526221 RepID=C9SP30_VERA1|nr:polygalacturonase [Verticillium alfalfae VaMs.102]EEY20545.1 polygalacturonase [Verticillium alfalfae VaMs.102]